MRVPHGGPPRLSALTLLSGDTDLLPGSRRRVDADFKINPGKLPRATSRDAPKQYGTSILDLASMPLGPVIASPHDSL